MTVIKHTFTPPACKINKNTLEKICKFLDEEWVKLKEDDKHDPHYEFQIKSNRKDLEFDSSKDFLQQNIPHDLRNISFNLWKYGDSHIRIEIDLDFTWSGKPRIKVSGRDSIWVNGVVKEIEDILKAHPSKNGIIHDKRSYVPIMIVVGILLSFVFMIAYYDYDLEKFDFRSLLFISGFGLIPSVLFFFQWLFPLLEYEEIGIQQKIRKLVFTIIGIIILGLITSALYDKFSQYQPIGNT